MIAAPLALALVAFLELAPGASYDPSIPTLKQNTGHDIGERISSPEEIVAYLRALAAAAPERTRLLQYGETWEGRPLHVLLIASRERIPRLDEVKSGLARLADPRGLGGPEADRLTRDLPVVTWLQHAVHGDEISSSDAALAEAYHLLAARQDPSVDQVLRESLVIIDPLQNPDGRARFLATNGAAQAPEPDPEPLAAEHDQPWPGGRYNHYLFDMNRDWFALSQLETRGRVKLMLEWPPQVLVDLHEMSDGNSSYYFAPPATPLNPHITPRQQEWLEAFGRANAARFDERGFAYFIRETYDSFYPGYGESWPIFNGAVGMTYEQASPRGLVWRRSDDMLLTYRDAVIHHFTAALATLDTAARNRERLLKDFLEYRRSAVAEGERGPVREYLIPPGEDPPRAERLARLLRSQGIEVLRAEEGVLFKGRTLPAGTFIVPLAQPSERLVRNLLDPRTALDETFLKEQDRRRKRRMPDQFYDLTGWSLPLAFDVECLAAETPTRARTSPLGPRAEAASLPPAKVGYLLPWGSEMAPAVAEALRAGLRVRVLSRSFTQSGRRYAGGTALVRTADNAPGARETLGAILGRRGLAAVAVDSGWVDEGISLGSSEGASLRAPRVLLAWDEPTETLSAGWARYVLERRFEQPVTVVRVGSLARLDLRRFDVMVLPSGDYDDALDAGAGRIKEWVRAGGTLVTLGDASRWATREKVGLLDTTAELRDGRPDVEPTEKEKDERKKDAKAAEGKPFDLEQALRPDRELPESTPGALVRASLDRDHWLAAGTDGEVQVVVEGRRVFTPLKLDKGRNVGLYAPQDRLVASGHAWEEARSLLAQKAFLMEQSLGHGHVVAFTEDPNYRAFSEATELLFLNAVLLGPSF